MGKKANPLPLEARMIDAIIYNRGEIKLLTHKSTMRAAFDAATKLQCTISQRNSPATKKEAL